MDTEKPECLTFWSLLKKYLRKINSIECFVDKPIEEKIITNYRKISGTALHNFVYIEEAGFYSVKNNTFRR